jgi:hypothetical protein
VNERLRIEDPDGVQEEHKRFVLVRTEEYPTSSGEESLVLPCTKVLVVGGYKLEREGEAPKMCKCGMLARDESNCVWIHLLSVRLERSLPSPLQMQGERRVTCMHYVMSFLGRKI